MVYKKIALPKCGTWTLLIFLNFLIHVDIARASRPDLLKVGLLKYQGAYDPYPALWRELAGHLEGATGVQADPIFRYPIEALPGNLAQFGLIFLLGSKDFPGFSDQERRSIGHWVRLGGGSLVVIDAETDNPSAFDLNIRQEINNIFGQGALEKIPAQNALLRSFYLIRGTSGVLARSRTLEGVKVGERYGLVMSANDILGALVRDREGNYLFRCYPGGEDQRKESFKMMINIFLYALTGTYKSDVIHLPFIEEKLKR